LLAYSDGVHVYFEGTFSIAEGEMVELMGTKGTIYLIPPV